MLRQSLVISALAFAAFQAHAAEAGKVIFASGKAQVADKAGAEGTAVQEGELLSTGADGFLYVKTVDNGLFILRPNTKARIVAYQIDRKNPANTRIKLELLSGVARSKSGDAVKMARQNFRFNTPVAAIGVRGTDFTVYTDQDTSRVAVLTGGVVVSGFAAGCRPDGGGPCEGGASRELFAAQRGQLLEVKRGDAAPELKQVTSNGPDQVSPPRPDEPVAKAGNGASATAPILDARKGDSIEKLVAQQPNNQQPKPPIDMPEIDPPVTSPLEPEQPQLPERAIKWGRWVALAGSPATIGLAAPAGASSIINGSYVIHRTAGRDYVTPERGNASFNLKGGEAQIQYTDPARAPTLAQMKNGVLEVDFGKASFSTSFDLVSGNEIFNMMADGSISRDGRFGNTAFVRPQTNNMAVDGVLGNEGNGTAAYLFQRRIDDQRLANGVTFWNK